jgi:hypothetical protein
VLKLLTDDEWGQWGDREIARRCAVSHPFVSAMRQESSGNRYQIGPETPRKVTRKGTEYAQKPRTKRGSELNGAREEHEPPPAPPTWEPAYASDRLRRAVEAEQARGGDAETLIYILKQIIKGLEA